MRSVNSIIQFKFPLAINRDHWRYESELGVNGLVHWDEAFFGVPKPNLATVQVWNDEYVLAHPPIRRRTVASLYAQLDGISFTNAQAVKATKLCLAQLLRERPELADNVSAVLGATISPNEVDTDVLEDRRL